ncbi:hypothetical protein [Actinacidiphila oryziradicis]|uniref:Uncharacterized protein n=1 Tax=Actinacidiphila oryziradicis TaxID=2571141 RepID=A0A4V6WJA9_9ACTN|nr:hypothetical protein [Actinacidiphila oryziradicis]TKA10969.1 hypothetical protein FCI23_13440 [Actinacidiphila oryziradicis]
MADAPEDPDPDPDPDPDAVLVQVDVRAAEQLRLTGVHATSLPWVYLDGEDPRRAFLGVRKRVGRQVAVRSLFSRAGA